MGIPLQSDPKEQLKMDPRLNIVTLGVADLQVARTFYETGLGWRVSEASNADIVFIPLGGLVLGLYPRDGLAEDAGIDPSGNGFRAVTLAQNVKRKEDVQDVLSLAERAGGTLVKPAQDVFWGGYHGYFADPDGHLWEIAWNPHFVLNAQGGLDLP